LLVVAQLADTAAAPVHIYGEMVEVLAEEGEFLAAAQLEELWNEVAQHWIMLLCGYSSAHFGPERSTHALEAICRSHSKVQMLPTDRSAPWPTATVSNGDATA
jgi:hypothetical protein